jgi:hypothetical protein
MNNAQLFETSTDSTGTCTIPSQHIHNCQVLLSKPSYYPSSVEIFDFYKQLQSIQYPLVKQVPEDQIDIFVSCAQDEKFRLFVVTP